MLSAQSERPSPGRQHEEGIVSGTLKEFRDFLLRGNLIQLAVAFVMGVAFAAVINSFVTNLVMPIIAAIVGKPNFNDLTFTIHHSVFTYGAFITDLITFVAIAAAVFFFIVKPVDMIAKRRAREEPEAEAISDEERRHQELLAALRARPS
jgi:large conductance mechanosensitive channel